MNEVQKKIAASAAGLIVDGTWNPALITGMVMALGLTDTDTEQESMRDSYEAGAALMTELYTEIAAQVVVQVAEEMLRDV